MIEQEKPIDDTSERSFGTAEEERKKIVADKAAIVDAREASDEKREEQEEDLEGESGANRPAGTMMTAERSTGVNPENEDPIDEKMPHMPPA